jgi:hypothetical protein
MVRRDVDTRMRPRRHGWSDARERIIPVCEVRRWPGAHDYPFSASAGPVVAELVRLARPPGARVRPVSPPADHLGEV